MPFSPIPETTRTFNDKRLEYMSLTPGSHVIRILDEDYVAIDTHYVNRVSIKCLGMECPICENNRKIIMDNPETFREVHGYYPRQTRFFLNVYDKTPVRICPQCKAEIKQTTIPTCPSCNTVIMSEPVAPLNKIKVLSKGKTLFENLISLENAVLDEQGNRRGLNNFDLTINVSGSGKNTITTPIFTGVVGQTPEVSEDAKFDLTKAVATLTPEEIRDFLMGVSLKDIFTARGTKHTEATKDVEQSEELKAAVQGALDLFKE